MIAHVRGKILEKQPTRMVVEMGGVGFAISTPLSTSQEVGEPGDTVALHTVLVVREDALTLYGFCSPQERDLFLKLIAVSGIGPKIALGALSGPPVGELVSAIRDQDLAFLTRLPGIGRKTAERMTVELKDSLIEFDGAKIPKAGSRSQEDAIAALVSLGYSRPASTGAVRKASGRSDPAANVEVLVRLALARLAGGSPEKPEKAVSRS